jgi:hypothetical protein
MNIATKLPALFGGQSLTASGYPCIARERLFGTLLGGDHPLRTTSIGASRRRSKGFLCHRACNKQPHRARRTRQSRPASARHSLSPNAFVN